ncbi:MAG: hypothetical protein LH472_04375 [Pyrinomonadaceae bacterium]|nr:hypothetical protein [Pyrinomonadaceae bacterium]
MANSHEARIEKIETESAELRRQILQFEFQHKKDFSGADQLFTAKNDQIQRHLDHLTKLVGITYEELDLLDGKLQETGYYLAQPRQRST